MYQRPEPHGRCEQWLILDKPIVAHTAVPHLLQSRVNKSSIGFGFSPEFSKRTFFFFSLNAVFFIVPCILWRDAMKNPAVYAVR